MHPNQEALPFLEGGGEVGALMRRHDWTRSPLGPPTRWPQSLRTVVGLLLTSKFPMFVAWGRELGFLYNDAYAEILGGKHPSALGARFYDIWTEIWPDIEPLIAAAMRGEATYRENLPLVMNRRGFTEQTWFTFSYSPVRDEQGTVAGMFCAVAETTEQVLGQARQAFRLSLEEQLHQLSEPHTVMAAAAEALGRELGVARVGYGEIDADEATVLVERDWTDGRVRSIAGRHRLSDFSHLLNMGLAEGRTMAIEDITAEPWLGGAAAAASFAAIETRALLAVPLIKAGRFTALLFLHHPEPRRWSQGDIHLVEEVADRTWAAVVRARAEGELRESEARFRALATAGSYSLYRMSADWSQLHQLDGRGFLADTQAPSVRWLEQYIHPDDQPRLLEAITTAIRTRGVFELEHRVRRADGSLGWALSRAVPIFGRDGQLVEWFGAASDVSPRREAEEELRRQTAALKEAVEARDTFLSVAGHELKTPLTPMALRLQSLARLVAHQPDSPFTQQVRNYTESAKRQIDKVAALVNDLLDVSRISAGRFKIELEPTDLAAIAREVVTRFEPEAQRAGSTLELRAPASLLARSAKLRVEQVITNLVDNAIKYGAGKPISLVLESDGDRARLTVHDQGIGIAAEHRSRIFERFERAVSERNYGGLGLGLYISRTIVEALGGAIGVQSEPGNGATFSVELPLREPKP